MKFIHTSDFHLGAEPESGRPWADARRDEIWKTVRRIIDDCNSEEIDLLMITGNLFHKQPLVKEIKILNDMFNDLKNTQVVIIAGNTDYLGARSRYRDFKWASNVIFIDSREISEVYLYKIDTTIYGLSHMDSEIYAPLYRDVYPKKSSGVHILMAHGGDAKCVPIDFEKLKKQGFDYVALGHTRNMRKFANNMYYAGSPEPIEKEDTGAHGYVKGEFAYENGKYALTSTFVPISLRKYIDLHVRVSGDDTNSTITTYVTDQILKQGAGNMYRIILEGIRNPNITFDKEAIALRGMITEVYDNTVLDYNYDELRALNEGNIIGAFMNKINEADSDSIVKDRALFYGIEALLKATEEKK